jgi:hypothetical protein
MGRRVLLQTLLVTFLLAGCSVSARKSLVGDWTIATDRELGTEKIRLWFRRENGSEYSTTLSYSLEPTGLPTIEKGRDHAACCFGGVDDHLTDWRSTKKLTKGQQISLRRKLGRLRPKSISKEFPVVLPPSCDFVFDTRAWGGVQFERGKEGGAFIFQDQCDEPSTKVIKQHLRAVVEALPAVEGSEVFFM